MLMKVHPESPPDNLPSECDLDREHIVEWVKRLRSGVYVQGFAALREGNRYCCLGVLREIIGASKMALNGDAFAEFLNAEESGLSENLQRHLASANDGTANSFSFQRIVEPGQRADFNRIADWIEQYLLS